MSEFLPTDIFIKTHKSFIVAINKVDSIDGNNVQIGNHLIPVSRSLKEGVMDKLLGKDICRAPANRNKVISLFVHYFHQCYLPCL